MPVAPGLLLAAQLAPVAISGIKSIQTARQRDAAEKALEAQVAQEKPNESILDFYNKAYNRYNPNAYQSAEYNAQMRNILSNQATGINSLQERRSALAGIPSIVQGTNVASQRAAAGAEAAQRANLGMLGQATSAKAGEENRIRQMKLNLMAQKAGQLAQTGNIQGTAALKGLQNAAIMGYYMNKDVAPIVDKTVAKTTSSLSATPKDNPYNLSTKKGSMAAGKLSPFATRPDFMSAWEESESNDGFSNYLNNPYFRK
jgi:hypothetical protein